MTFGKTSVLIVDDDASIRQTIAVILESSGFRALAAETGQQALDICAKEQVHIMLLDVQLPDINGIEILRRVRATFQDIGVVMISVVKEIAVGIEAMKLGALDYLTKDFTPTELALEVVKVIGGLRDQRELLWLRKREAVRAAEPMVIGPSPASISMEAAAKRVANTALNVLITGETGAGKQVLARYLHENSKRRDRLFVDVRIPQLSPEALALELFGQEGSSTAPYGVFEYAEGGTLFLDEISDLTPELQARLLHAVETKEIVRVGGRQRRRFDVKVVCSSNRNLEEEILARRFRPDLYSLVSGVMLNVPPLRERVEDIPLLAQHFAQPKTITPAALALLQFQKWPRNIRQLKQAITRASEFSDVDSIGPEALPEELERPATTLSASESGHSYDAHKDLFERRYFAALWSRHGRDVKSAARESGFSEGYVRQQFQKYELWK